MAAAAIMSMTVASARSDVVVPDPERGRTGTEQRSVPGQPARVPALTAQGVVLGSGGTAEQILPVVAGDQGIPAAVYDLPDGCTVTSATLRLDPGAAAAERAVQAERVADEWPDQTARTLRTVGDAVTADAGTGERAWSVDALLAALVQGPDHGLLLSTAGDGDPVPLIGDGNARLEIVLGAP